MNFITFSVFLCITYNAISQADCSELIIKEYKQVEKESNNYDRFGEKIKSFETIIIYRAKISFGNYELFLSGKPPHVIKIPWNLNHITLLTQIFFHFLTNSDIHQETFF